MYYDVKSVIQVSQRLIDNSEQALLVFQDAGLDKDNVPYFGKIIEITRKQLIIIDEFHALFGLDESL